MPILQSDNVQTINQRVLKYEHKLYPKVISDLVNGNIVLKNGKVYYKNGASYNDEVIISNG